MAAPPVHASIPYKLNNGNFKETCPHPEMKGMPGNPYTNGWALFIE